MKYVSRIAAIALIAALPVLALAKNEEKSEPVGKTTVSSSMIEWAPSADHESIEVVVQTPDGDVWKQTFKNGKPVFRVKDLGAGNVDGSYSYELRLVPRVNGSVKAQLNAAREAGDDKEAARIMKAAGLSRAVVQSGAFAIVNGAIISPDAVEQDANDGAAGSPSKTSSTASSRGPGKITTDDTVIPDDLIVQSSTCTGFDCVDGESFGFDTLRLKENNLRIHFDDTSASAGFPANDWRIIANDSASGGANKFAVEDSTAARNPFTIEAGAPVNTLYVDSTGRIGIQQSAPVLDLHITTSNTPAMRLEQTSAGGFTAQTWDIGANEANFFVRDLTGGSRLPFRIRPGAPTSSIDISASGQVGIGTASPSANLQIFSTETTDSNVTLGPSLSGPALNVSYTGGSFGRSSAALNVRPDASAVAPNPSLRLFTANVQRMIIDNEGFIGIGTTTNPDAPIHYTNGGTVARLTTAGVWQDASSRAAKENIVDLSTDEAMCALHELKPVKYNYIVAPEDPKVGFIAEDVPELVAVPERNGLSALDIVGVLTKVVQEQQATIEKLNQRLDQIEQKNQQ
jgi:hypothetical protein